jgi:energy-converting hydrogenase Eha subunit A
MLDIDIENGSLQVSIFILINIIVWGFSVIIFLICSICLIRSKQKSILFSFDGRVLLPTTIDLHKWRESLSGKLIQRS